ncbi:MAG: MinD/ParA family protein [Solirubrobacterales bacterium]
MLDQADKLRKLTEKGSRKPTIITVTSGKGGVGKSNFVVNLSIALQKAGKKVLIFDADMGMGNDDVLMGFYPKYNIYDIIFNNMEISDVIIEGSYGVKLLPGGTGITKLDQVTEQQRESFIDKLSCLNDLDYILIDTGAGVNRDVLAYVSCCNELIIVTTPEPTSITDAYSLLKMVNHFKIKTSANIVVNRILTDEEGKYTFDKFNNAVSSFLKVKLQYLGYISEDKKIAQSVRKQEPFIVSYPHCVASKDVEKIADKIMGSSVNNYDYGVQNLFRKIFSMFS